MSEARRVVSLAIESEALSVEEISKKLHMLPDKAVAKGDVRLGSISGIPSRRTVWELIEPGDATADVTSLLQRMAARIAPVIRELKMLNNEENQRGLFRRVVCYAKFIRNSGVPA